MTYVSDNYTSYSAPSRLMEECERLKRVCDNEKERCTVLEEKLAELSSIRSD